MSYLGVHQASVDAARAASMEALRAFSVRATAARQVVQEGRAAAGLVSVSTTCRGKSVAEIYADHVVTIDPAQARVTRLRKGLGIAAKQLHNQGQHNQQIWMQTLTYAGDNRDWKPEHISRYLDALRKWHYSVTGSKTVRYAWVAELQKRGVIHYHVIVWLAGGLTPPMADKPWRSVDRKGLPTWHEPMWPHGMSRRDKSTAPVAYLMKYASKVESKNVGSFPHGARIHGAGGLGTLLAALSVAGFCGLRMCRAMLRSPTASDLRREAVIAMTRQESFSWLSSHQQAAVFAALSASGPRLAPLTQPVRSPGLTVRRPRFIEVR